MSKDSRLPISYQPYSSEHQLSVLKMIADVVQSSSTPGFDWTPEALRDEFKTSECWLLWVEEGLGGFLSVRNLGSALEIQCFVVARKFWGSGVAATFLRSWMQEQKSKNMHSVKEIWLEVHEGNTRAQNLYVAAGFRKVGERPRYYSDGGGALLMSADLR